MPVRTFLSAIGIKDVERAVVHYLTQQADGTGEAAFTLYRAFPTMMSMSIKEPSMSTTSPSQGCSSNSWVSFSVMTLALVLVLAIAELLQCRLVSLDWRHHRVRVCSRFWVLPMTATGRRSR